MSAINVILEKITLPLADIATGQSVAKHLRFLQKSQWWSADELRAFQEQRLQKLIKHSVETVPYYNELFKINGLKVEDINTVSDLKKIPILTKEIIKKEGLERFTSSAIPPKKRMRRSSSGSTGEPLVYYTTKEAYSANIAANLRGWYWMGYRLGDKFVKISNSPRSKLKKIQDHLSRNKCIYFNKTDEESLLQIIKEVNAYQPTILRAYNAPLSLIIKTAKKHNIKTHSPFAVNTTGSVLQPDFRNEVESSLGCKIFDSYSCEGGANVFECETHECYHSTMEYAVKEILDQGGCDTSYGRLITTDLWNYATPFIRYDSQDIIELFDKKCSCGRVHTPIKKIIGRDYDILVTPSGSFVTPLKIGVFFRSLDNIEQYQVRQETKDHYLVYIKTKVVDIRKTEQIIQDFWNTNFGKEANLDIKVVNDIPLTRSGKRRYVIRSKDVPLNL